MQTLFKSLVLSRLDYGSRLWSSYKFKDINLLESVQRSFTRHIEGMSSHSYTDRLSLLNCILFKDVVIGTQLCIFGKF